MAAKIKGLQQWCRKMTDGYAHVDIANFTSSWRDGMAFCAIIHRFRPDLIDYDSLSPKNVFENNKLAFEVAERELDIPAFLEAEDMARLKVPDKLSVITYVSQYYNFLNALPQLGGPGVKGKSKANTGTKRTTEPDPAQAPSVKKAVPSLAVRKENAKPSSETKTSSLGDKCGICQNKVYLLERHIEGGKLYHRSCFRHSELSPTNKVFTKSPFMSPSLSSEGPKSPTRSKLSQLHSPTRVKAAGGDVGTPGLGTKHSLIEPDREDSKKSKLQQVNSTVEPFQKSKDTGLDLPLSGKEARKLEKRHQEILGAEKSVPQSTPKRSVPLIFQQKDKTEGVAVSSPSSGQNVLSKDSESILRKSSGDSQQSDVPSRRSTQDSAKLGLHKSVGLPSVQNLQEKFSRADGDLKDNPKNAPHPVARPRLGIMKPGESKSDSITDKKPSDISPRAAPRKSVEPLGVKKSAPQRPKSPPHIKSSASVHCKSSSEASTPRSSKSPPPLPTSPPPPLPTSPPPPLPSNNPVGQIKQTPNLSETTALSHTKKTVPKETPDSEKSSDTKMHSGYLEAKSKLHPVPEHSQTSQNNNTSQVPPMTSHGPVKSTVLPDSSVSANTSYKGVDRRWSSPANNVALYVVPPEDKKEEKVLTGLLASLAGVRKRSGSTPTVDPNVPQSLATSGASLVPSTLPSSSSTTTTFHTSTSASKTSLTTTSTVSSSVSSSISSNMTKPSMSTFTSTGFSSQDKTPVAPARRKVSDAKSATSTLSSPAGNKLNALKVDTQKPEALNVLSKLKHVESSSTGPGSVSKKIDAPSDSGRFSDTKKGTDSAVKNEPIKSILKKDGVSSGAAGLNVNKNTKTILSGQGEKERITIDLKGQDPKGRSEISKEHPVAPHRKVHPASSLGKEEDKSGSKVKGQESDIKSVAPHFSEVKLKRVLPEEKTTAKVETSKTAFDVKLNKVGAEKKDSEMPSGLKNGDSGHAVSVSTKTNVKVSHMPLDNKTVVSSQALGKSSEISRAQPTIPVSSDVKTNDVKKNSDDIPQWKKDIEERKKKLREDIAKSEADIHIQHRRPSEAGKDRPKSMDILDLKSKDKKSDVPQDSIDSKVSAVPEKPDRPKSMTILDKEMEEKKLNWQLEAERCMAALGGFDSEDEIKDTKENAKPHRKLPSILSVKSSKSDVKTAALKSSKENLDKGLTSSDKLVKDLKPVTDGKVSVSDDVIMFDRKKVGFEKEAVSGEEGQVKKEDFRDKLHNLKHVGVDKDQEPPKFKDVRKEDTESTPSKPGLTKPHKLLNTNNNMLDKNGIVTVKDEDHISKIFQKNFPTKGSSLEKSSNVKIYQPQNSTNQKEEQKTPPLKRRITVLGRNQKDVESPPETPVTRKKIEVGRAFDFELSSESTDMESSLSSSTSKLTIEETPPSRPPPPRHVTTSPGHISAIELQQQLMDIDNRLTDLELRGRDLEDSIRNVVDANEEEEDDELMIEWFKLISEKNDLVRQEADLVYISREQDLEGEQEHIEHQLRYLLGLPDSAKSPEEKQEEDYLLQRKLELVDQRDCIVNSMDEDRLRYLEEDRDIEVMLKDKGLWMDTDGSLRAEKALKGKKVAKSKFYV